jgi:hypothetical protein
MVNHGVEGIEPPRLAARDFESGAYQSETDYEKRYSSRVRTQQELSNPYSFGLLLSTVG